jgi:WD40 repeat protein
MAPASGKEGVQILELATGAPVRVLRSGSKLEGAVKELSFSGDGLHLAAWSRAEVIVWKPATGEVEARLEFQLEQEGKSASRFHSVLTSAGFDRRGHLVACGRRRKGDSNLVGLWNATTSEPVLEFPEGSTEFSHIYLSPGGESALALVPGGWIAHVVEIPGGRTLGVWKASSRRRIVDAESATFSPDGRWVAFCNRVDEPASALRAGEPVHGIPPPDDVEEPDPEAEVGGVSKDERALPGLSLWTLPDGRESLALRTPSEPLCIAFSPDARFVAAGCIDGSLLLWEIKGATLLVHSGVRTGPLLHLAFAPEAALAYGDGRSPLVTIHLDALRVHLARRGLGW